MPFSGRSGPLLARYALIAALVLALLYLGLEPGPWQALLTRAAESGLPAPLRHWLQQHTSAQVTARSLPGMALYSLSYCALAALLTTLVLASWARVPRVLRQVARAYGLGFGLCLVLLALGYAGVGLALVLARHLIDGLVSPLPVVVLIGLYYRPSLYSPEIRSAGSR